MVGRPKPGVDVDLDLTPDDTVSRPHCRLWEKDGLWWIEDVHSTHGTRLNGKEIRGAGPCPLEADSQLEIGLTMLRLEIPASALQPEPAAVTDTPPGLEIAGMMEYGDFGLSRDSDRPLFLVESAEEDLAARLGLLCELPLHLNAEQSRSEERRVGKECRL